jgi:hypothetical protein
LQKKRKAWLQEGVVPTDYPYLVAADYPDLLEIIRKKVKPERDKLFEKGNITAEDRAKKWWRYGRMSLALYSAVKKLDRVMVRAQVSNKWAWNLTENNRIIDAKLVAFPLSYLEFPILQSEIHYYFSYQYGTTLKSDLSYTPTTNFETFPFPDLSQNPKLESALEAMGKKYHEHRKKIMLQNEEGLTKTYNRFHNPEEPVASGKLTIQSLRDHHVEMDKLVRDAYGWGDLDLGHGFHSTKQGVRFTISESARKEVLSRLLELNHKRFAEEKSVGLWDEEIQKGKV